MTRAANTISPETRLSKSSHYHKESIATMSTTGDEEHVEGDDDAPQPSVIAGDKSDPRYKYGIIYLSYIPDGLTVKMLREIMSPHGEVGRIYLEPDENNPTTKCKKYIEGWVEFKKKKVAKAVAKSLNGTTLQYGKKHSRLAGQIWSMKYLHKFKWAHLTEQLANDRATRDQRRRFEMSQAKKQVDFYQRMTERSKIMRNRRNKKNDETTQTTNPRELRRIESLKTKQNKPIQDGDELSVHVDKDLLSSIFKKVS